MLKLSALLSLLRIHLKAHETGGASLPPEAAGTVANLLSSCEAYAKDMEAALHSVTAAPVDLRPLFAENVVSLSAFIRARKTTPPNNPNETA
ncbi:hypothetical protein [Rhizobium nepotum]|uniref:Uncharacterized protein n=1 Tax=Rhizobium nepotum 39/7 TaxID=1368418 RepID=A0ABR5CRF0_9HYPH|nr:hypothetical protein [Rhizobium nepotum]KJF67418.1 hypothetical protein RS75_13170 [Rhizobium nepotum 39/7]